MAHVFAAVLLGVIFFLFSSWHVSTTREKGKQAYLSEQATYFDKRVATHHSGVIGCMGAIGYIGGCVGVYELVALAVYEGIRPRGGGRAA